MLRGQYELQSGMPDNSRARGGDHRSEEFPKDRRGNDLGKSLPGQGGRRLPLTKCEEKSLPEPNSMGVLGLCPVIMEEMILLKK